MLVGLAFTISFAETVIHVQAKNAKKANQASATQSTSATPSTNAPPPTTPTSPPTNTSPPATTSPPTTTTSHPISAIPPWVAGPTPGVRREERPFEHRSPVYIPSELHPK